MNNNLIILVGLPGSGKTTWSRNSLANPELEKYHITFYDPMKVLNWENTEILSSDEIRKELFGSLDQNNNQLVFETMNKRCKDYLKEDKNVIYDATNLNRKRRMALINEMKKHCRKVSCYCFICDFEEIKERNLNRGDENVPKYALERMLKNFQMPLLIEGFHNIKFINTGAKINYLNLNDDYFSNNSPLKDIRTKFKSLLYAVTDELIEYDQINQHHNETLGNHIKTVISECYLNSEDMKDYDRIILLLSAFYHDMGKPYCQELKENENGKKYATYQNHNYVSSYLMVNDYMASMDDFNFMNIGDFVLLDLIQLIEYHDFMFSYKDIDKAKESMLKKVSERIWYMLNILHNADRKRTEEN